MIFARIVNGVALEPQPNNSAAEYAARFDAYVVSTWGPKPVIAQVPEAVQHCAKYLGGSTLDPAQFVNPDKTDGNGNPPPPATQLPLV